MEKIDARSLSPKAQERLRQLAVNAVLEGKKQVEVAKLFSVTRRAVSKWLKAYRSGAGGCSGQGLLPPGANFRAKLFFFNLRGGSVFDAKGGQFWLHIFTCWALYGALSLLKSGNIRQSR